MRERVVTWSPELASLGPSVVAIGVFDGVHLGHQKLLKDAAAEARRLGVRSVALTFDRDPDQVVTPEAAAPQLLTLQDKCRFILECAIQTVLVVPFTHEIAATEPDTFLDQVLGACCDVSTIHVGADFRFGARAGGDVETLKSWSFRLGAKVRPHILLESEGRAVTSTRIRRLVAAGDVREAAALLGRATRVSGQVHRGREQGRELGFPTANVVPVPYAALPADGVYAGRVVLADGSAHAAAVSIGVPPTFPDARDYIEAHIIGFEGDLYGARMTLEFIERLRSQQAFNSLGELSAAIRTDVERAGQIVEASAIEAAWASTNVIQDTFEQPFELNPLADLTHKGVHTLGMDIPLDETLEDGTPVVEDPDALADAEADVAGIDHRDDYRRSDEEWVELVGKRKLSGMFGEAGYTAALITAPLHAAEIPFVWDPYPPEAMPSFRPAYGVFDRPFALLVPRSRLGEAQAVMDAAYGSAQSQRLPAPHPSRRAPTRAQGTGSPVVKAIIWLVIVLVFVVFVFGR